MYITENNITKLSSMNRHSMERFRGRGIKLFRSYDSDLTQKYHGRREGEECFFELITMNYKFGEPQYLIRYPYTDFFVELAGGGGSMRGEHEHIHLTNPIKDIIDPYYYEGKLDEETLEFYRFGSRTMLTVNKFRHEFLDRIYDVDEYVLSKEYVQIPDIRDIAYSFFSPKYQKYLIVDQSRYNFQYDTMRLFFGDVKGGMSECKMKNFVRYRDGGTTLFDFEHNGIEYKFHNPTRLGGNHKPTTLNESPIENLSEIEVNMLTRNLNILVKEMNESNSN
jgi:hypothetical protein